MPDPDPVSVRRRVPALAVAAWAVAVVIVAALVAGVVHYLGDASTHASHGMKDMSGMTMSGGSSGGSHADAITRGGADLLGPLSGSRIVTAWQLDAIALALLVIAAAAYLTGVALAPLRSDVGRWPLRRTLSFLAGLAVCAFATNGSIAVYDQVLFSAHMLGHLSLVMLGPVLIVAGRPLRLAMLASPPARRDRLARVARGRVIAVITAPPVALATYTAVIVGSHLTGVMDTIMRNTWAGQVEHLVYVLAGIQFFSLIVGDEPIRWRLSAPARFLLLAVAMAVDTFTGIVLLQGTRVVDAMSSPAVPVNGLSDTRTGGAIMWVGGDAIMAAVMIVIALAWISSVDRDETMRERDRGWLEQARRATFSEHTGHVAQAADGDDEPVLDEDESARESYNKWLSDLAKRN